MRARSDENALTVNTSTSYRSTPVECSLLLWMCSVPPSVDVFVGRRANSKFKINRIESKGSTKQWKVCNVSQCRLGAP